MLTLLHTHYKRKLPSEVWDMFFSEMPDDLKTRISRFKRWQDRHSTLIGRLLLIIGLSEYGLSKGCLDSISYDDYGRPYLNGGIDFNISHSGQHVICCISDQGRVGVDVEEIRSVNIQEFQRYMSKEQIDNIKKSEDMNGEFFKYWTSIESVMKANGKGLTLPLSEVMIEDGTARAFEKIWYLRELDIGKNYSCHLATDNYNNELQYKSLSFR